MDGFEKRRQRIKQKIKDAAWNLFEEKGYKNVSMQTIAAVAEVSKVSIYNFFEHKLGLVEELLIDYLHVSFDNLQNVVQQPISFLKKLELLLAQPHNPLSASPNLFQEPEIIAVFFQEDKLPSNPATIIRQAIEPLLSSLIAQGKKEGTIEKNIEQEAILSYIKALRGLMDLAETTKEKLDYSWLLLYGLRGK